MNGGYLLENVQLIRGYTTEENGIAAPPWDI